ncbi:nuclear body protein SP140-like protein isoform 1-T1 [Hipposideros larvatus]
MFSIVKNKETVLHETFLNHFKENKVEIANAITKPFPFLESLRDRSFITDKLYNDSQEAYRSLVPLGKVVYHILCHLEKTFDGSLLQAIFSRTHLKEYPDLIQVHRSFEDVIQEKYFSQERDREETQILSSIQPSYERVPVRGMKKERESEELPSLLLNGGQSWRKVGSEESIFYPTCQKLSQEHANNVCGCQVGAELSKYDNLVQSGAVVVELKDTISPCCPKMNQGGQQARPACDRASEIIVISSEPSEEGAPLEA